MRKNLLLWMGLISLTCLVACANGGAPKNPAAPANAASDTANYTRIHWVDSLKDFGSIPFGQKVKIVYAFENAGNKPLYITSVRPTCGCTVADYTHTAVLPGKSGNITAEFDSNHGVPGDIRKSIVVSSNTINDRNYVLAFTGTVTK
ncbi:MAG TPA: DUF1573 domain-containing protein [Arachidicoccus sp.]|nr:DUF1573 domain-containing protein [Arachidicoccus sp.]